jgi:hypothetical protein
VGQRDVTRSAFYVWEAVLRKDSRQRRPGTSGGMPESLPTMRLLELLNDFGEHELVRSPALSPEHSLGRMAPKASITSERTFVSTVYFKLLSSSHR